MQRSESGQVFSSAYLARSNPTHPQVENNQVSIAKCHSASNQSGHVMVKAR